MVEVVGDVVWLVVAVVEIIDTVETVDIDVDDTVETVETVETVVGAAVDVWSPYATDNKPSIVEIRDHMVFIYSFYTSCQYISAI